MIEQTTYSLGTIAFVQTGPFGSQLHQEDYVEIGTPIITVEHLIGNRISHENLPLVSDDDKERLSKYILKEGDIVFSRVGSVDRCAYVSKNEDGWLFSGRCLRIRVDETKVNPRYLSFYFANPSFKSYIRQIAVGATMPSLNTTIMNELEIPLPPLPVQKKIAAILSSLDDKIANNTAINHHLEQMAQAIFKSWFVDFEPFGGEMPDDWREGTLSEIANITMGQSPDGSSYNEDGIGTVFYQGRAEFGSRFPTHRLFTVQPKRMATKGDVLMSVRAPVGDLNVAFESCCIGRGLASIQSNNDCQSFILYTMFALKQRLDMFNGEGTVFGSINKNDMANLPVLIPTDEVLRQFEELVNPMNVAIETNYTENCNLRATRDSLLPRLMSDELSVADLGDAK